MDLSFDIKFELCNAIVSFAALLAVQKTYQFPDQPTSADRSTAGLDEGEAVAYTIFELRITWGGLKVGAAA
jgi:hypothetical protein